MQPASVSASEVLPFDESYPWAVHTPEASPRSWDIMPSTHCFVPQASVPSFDLLQTLCMPYLEQMCCSIQSDLCVHHMPADATASREMLRTICEPFFEHMIDSLQHGLQQQAMSQSFTSTCF